MAVAYATRPLPLPGISGSLGAGSSSGDGPLCTARLCVELCRACVRLWPDDTRTRWANFWALLVNVVRLAPPPPPIVFRSDAANAESARAAAGQPNFLHRNAVRRRAR